MITATPLLKSDAEKVWADLIVGLDGVAAFGPDFSPDHVPGERWWDVREDGVVVGLGWVRRFLKTGGVMNRGYGILPTARGRNVGAVALDVIDAAVWDAYPDAKTIISIAWSTNPTSLSKVRAFRKEIGSIPFGDAVMHIFLVGERE